MKYETQNDQFRVSNFRRNSLRDRNLEPETWNLELLMRFSGLPSLPQIHIP